MPPDLADDANDTAEVFLQSALLKQQRHATATPAGIGICLFCGEDVEGERRWCDAECRDEWQTRQGRV